MTAAVEAVPHALEESCQSPLKIRGTWSDPRVAISNAFASGWLPATTPDSGEVAGRTGVLAAMIWVSDVERRVVGLRYQPAV